MTAFEDILTAEDEALKSIETAREEVASAVFEARAERKTRIDSEALGLKEVEDKEMSSHQTHIKVKTDKIQSEVDIKILAVEKEFGEHSASLTKEIKSSFA